MLPRLCRYSSKGNLCGFDLQFAARFRLEVHSAAENSFGIPLAYQAMCRAASSGHPDGR